MSEIKNGTQFSYGSNRWEITEILNQPVTRGTKEYQKITVKAIASLGRGTNLHERLPLYDTGQEAVMSTYHVQRSLGLTQTLTLADSAPSTQTLD